MAEIAVSTVQEQSISVSVATRPLRISHLTQKTAVTQGLATNYKRCADDTVSVCANEKVRRVVVPSNLDLPAGVIKSPNELTDYELMPSVFGGFSHNALERAHIIEKKNLESFNEIRSHIVKGIDFKKCARIEGKNCGAANSKVQSRTLTSNPCFTSFKVKGGRRERTFYASDFVGLAKGKASEELKRADDVFDQNCLVLIAQDRTLSTVWESEQRRDEMHAALKVLLHLKPENC